MQTIAYKSIASLSNRQRQLCRALLLRSIFVLLGWTFIEGVCSADDWMTWPSTYTHEPTYGQRVDQFAPAAQPLAQRDPTFQRSGFRHYRSTLQAGNSADNMHIVEQWGSPVVPYEQWRFPFRPYACPTMRGPTSSYGILNANIGGFGPGSPLPHGGMPHGYPPAGPNAPQPGVGQVPNKPQVDFPNTLGTPTQANGTQIKAIQTLVIHREHREWIPSFAALPESTWYDGNYPVAPPLDTRSDAEFFYTPQRNP